MANGCQGVGLSTKDTKGEGAQGLSIVGHGEMESVSITLTLKGEGVSCLVDEPVS